jgi:hypothetical protein
VRREREREREKDGDDVKRETVRRDGEEGVRRMTGETGKRERMRERESWGGCKGKEYRELVGGCMFI